MKAQAILQAMATIVIIETTLPELHHVLKLSGEKCATDLAALRAQLENVEGDIENMGLIIHDPVHHLVDAAVRPQEGPQASLLPHARPPSHPLKDRAAPVGGGARG